MRVRQALPPLAVLALAVAGTGVATAAPAPVELQGVQQVASLGDDWANGLEVDSTTITWGTERGVEGFESRITSHGYVPAVGDGAVTLTGEVTPPIAEALYAATTDAWAIGFDPYVSMESGQYGLWVQDRSTEVTVLMHLAPSFGPWDGSVALWGDTAVVGDQVVDLPTGETFVLVGPGGWSEEELAAEPWRCLDGSGAAIDHGVLVAYDVCRSAVVTVDVPASGITAEALNASTVLVESDAAGLFALSGDGLLAYVETGREGPSRLVWRELGSAAEPSVLDLPGEPAALRADGRRMVVVTTDGEMLTPWLVEAGAGLVGPLADVSLQESFIGGPVAMLAEPGDSSSAMNLDYLPIDLRDRTLAWSTGAEILVGTLPALSAEAAPALVLPETVAAGGELTVVGTGFLAGEEVVVSFGADVAGVAVADADGAFSLTIDVPAGATGEQAVTAVGVGSGWSAAGVVTVTGSTTPPPPAPPTTPTPGQNPGLEVQTGR